MGGWLLPRASVLAFFLAACASSKGIIDKPLDAGVGRSFDATFDRVVAASRNAMVGVGLEVESSRQVDEKTLMMLGDRGGFVDGEKVRVLVRERADSRIEVRIYTKRKDIFSKGDWSKELFDRIQQEVGAGSVEP